MRFLRWIGFALAFCVPTAAAYGAGLDYQGYAFETGGLPPSEPGDELQIPFIVNSASEELGLDPAAGEITGWVSGLVSTGTQDAGDGVLLVTYGTGRVDIYRDPSSDHDFGTLPPNATVPGSFTNGELCLAGTLTDFVLYFDTETRTGAYQGTVVLDSGACLGALGTDRLEGFTFGGVLSPEAVGAGNVPEGYDLQVDGFLEAQKVTPPETCEFECFGIQEARFDFPRHKRSRCGPKDGKFSIDGNFLPCTGDSTLDPELVEVRVRIGDFQQTFPAGTLERDDGRRLKWEYKNKHGSATLNELQIEFDRDGHWEFEIEGRGIERSLLLPEDNQLVLELCIGSSCGTEQVPLVQKKSRLRYKSRHEPCERSCDDDPDAPDKQPGPIVAAQGPELLPAAPNPFNATTTIALRTAEAGDVRVRIFDVRGRLVRQLHSGTLPLGEHRFAWRGEDEQGAGVASGVYVYRVDAPGIATSRKLVVAK